MWEEEVEPDDGESAALQVDDGGGPVVGCDAADAEKSTGKTHRRQLFNLEYENGDREMRVERSMLQLQ